MCIRKRSSRGMKEHTVQEAGQAARGGSQEVGRGWRRYGEMEHDQADDWESSQCKV